MEQIGTRELGTGRLRLRRLVPRDAEEMFVNWAADESVTRYLTWDCYADIEECRDFISGLAYDQPTTYIWGIELVDGGNLIGTIDAALRDFDTATFEIGYVIGEPWWNFGYATEAAGRVMEFLFSEVGAECIRAGHDTRNQASGRVMEKCGMVYEGTLRRNVRVSAGIGDAATYSILADEWYGRRANAPGQENPSGLRGA